MWVEFALIGLLSGYFAGFLGIGGGFIVVPALTFLFLKDPETAPWAIHMAVATSLTVMLVTSLSSLLAHHRKGAIHWPLVRSMAAGLAGGAILGAAIADFLQGEVLVRIFGLFAILAGFQLIISRHTEGGKALPVQPSASVAGGVIGSISALIGIGGGAMTVPWLLWHGVHPKNAVATSAACGYPIAIAGSLSFLVLGQGGDLPDAALGYVYLPAFAVIALLGALAAPLGAATIHRLPPAAVQRFLGLFLALVGAHMLINF
jgi:uncharacterized membrane protein YfcA